MAGRKQPILLKKVGFSRLSVVLIAENVFLVRSYARSEPEMRPRSPRLDANIAATMLQVLWGSIINRFTRAR